KAAGGSVRRGSLTKAATRGASVSGAAKVCSIRAGAGANPTVAGAARISFVIRKPALSTSVATAAISTVGNFFGKAGTFDTVAREITRASAGVELSVSRAVAS